MKDLRYDFDIIASINSMIIELLVSIIIEIMSNEMSNFN